MCRTEKHYDVYTCGHEYLVEFFDECREAYMSGNACEGSRHEIVWMPDFDMRIACYDCQTAERERRY
ncbi:hypothetical protein SPI_07456 [Niveomyces insectorum RCEF 264]|uniref:Uncharacterized protein n=1 Tax=Niveomyces insectorum RCEF 264 TaxID=1081102 RepID=A0A162IH45_9HYPO|nr:hypothetical protein SPI_07456 [Niveomyces insectorum RCEF 264]